VKVRFQEFDPHSFSFEKDPVLVLEGFWSPGERAQFQDAMRRAPWKTLSEIPGVSQVFQNCGNWAKAEIVAPERGFLLNRLSLPCIMNYVESFPNVTKRHVTSSYYTYTAGDCLSLHCDLDEGYSSDPQVRAAVRRVAMVTYLHDEWHPDWGGELIIYEARQDRQGKQVYEVSHCIAPQPGSLVLFTVPRFHRVCRVDALAGDHKRLSIAGWIMTEH
jgi:SM-20-related protein